MQKIDMSKFFRENSSKKGVKMDKKLIILPFL